LGGRRRTPLAVAVLVATMLAGDVCAGVWWDGADRGELIVSGPSSVEEIPRDEPARAAPSPLDGLAVIAEPDGPAAPPTSTTLAGLALPVPEPLPADPYADTPEVVLGRITIPAIGLDEPLQQGMTLTAINRGPSHWPGTALPGDLGNAVIAGHRTTYTQPFRRLDELQAGDQVIYTTDRAAFTYAVTATEIVLPEDVRIADQTAGYTSTLFACHPPGSAAYRIVTHLQLLDGQGRPVPAPAVPLAPVTIPRPA
jgi:LPXTG-site transpeptidase (sortase) family protein